MNKKVSKKKYNILGVITARGGSKGIPGKNIKRLGRKPLIAYSIAVAKKSALLSDVIVSTDADEIAAVARKYGAEVPFLRPKQLAGDTVTHVPVMRHAIEFMERERGIQYDFVVILQPTSPFRLSEDIDKTLRKLIQSGADSAVTLVEAENAFHPLKAKRVVDGRVFAYSDLEPEGIRRQDLPRAYRRSGDVYAMKRATIMEKGLLYGEHIVAHIIPQYRAIDIDEPFDWLKAEYMLKELKKQGYDF